MREEIGKRIKEIRESMNMTKESFAKKLGISGQYLGIVERGGSYLSIEKIKALCDFTNLSADYILFGQNKNVVTDTEKLLTKFSNTQIEEGCNALKDLARFLKTLEEEHNNSKIS